MIFQVDGLKIFLHSSDSTSWSSLCQNFSAFQRIGGWFEWGRFSLSRGQGCFLLGITANRERKYN